MEGLSCKKRVREDSDDSEFTLPEVKRLREDLFDDSDFCTTSQDLDSFMKSFEDEISGSSLLAVVDLESDSGDSRPDLGYLLEASDDELGLPPSMSTLEKEVETELVRAASDASELSELWGFEEQISGYDSFDFGFGDTVGQYNNSGDYVALDGLFDYSEIAFGASDLSRHPETLPAL